ncbi:oxygenase MpaB family protein [Arthrobacter sp. SLBN-53]|uniref:oxygenase MpaB family protein n=1 Tax=Arthrobacter sp. SLBN-53 TaxID=2768412 RepID=UPI001154CBD8|nr:oxygenase MpaB family protein [Arthrobacter sp. SLBN-53]TQK32052.1 uncharacterized protein (DUF2236 family) [Arthrobacter sp. SLBN-53]
MTEDHSLERQPVLDENSLLWRWLGDMRITFEGGTAGLLQTMHPAIGHALIDHSDFFANPVDRVFRSLPGILGSVYRADADTTATSVRDYHRTITGELPDGSRYHALTPNTFWWAHATFQRMVDRVAQHWDHHDLTTAESEQLYLEGCVWYRRYGVSTTPLPPHRYAFEQKLHTYCTHILQPNPASDFLIDLIDRGDVPDMSASPSYPTTAALKPYTDRLLPNPRFRAVLGPPMRLTIFGGLPAPVRHRFGIRWSRRDELAYRGLRATVRAGWPLVPESLRWHSEAAHARKRTMTPR